MTDRGILLGIDVGTTGTKVVAVESHGLQTVAQAEREYPSRLTDDGGHEQDPVVWWRAVTSCTTEVMARLAGRPVAAVGLSGQMHSLLLLDEKGDPVRLAMTWADRRAGSATKELAVDPRFRARTGNDVTDAFTAPKLAWLASEHPELLARARRLVLAKDYVRLRLTGGWGTDVTDAMGTLLYDVHARRWDPALFAACGASADLAPPVSRSTDVIGTVLARAARQTSIPEGTPVVAGAGDVSAVTVGTGVVDRSGVCLNAGTAAQAMGIVPDPEPGDGFVFGSAVGDGFVRMSSVYAAGASIRWAGRRLVGSAGPSGRDGPDGAAGHLPAALLDEVPPGSRGLVYLPFMFGATLPRKNDAVRASFVGLREACGVPEMVRAVVEGVAFACADAARAVVDQLANTGELRVVGGVANSAVWRQALAASVGMPVVWLPDGGSPLGAAILAGLGTGTASVDGIAAVLGGSRRPEHVEEADATAYRSAYKRYREVCAQLV